MITLNFNEDSEKLINLLAKRSPQQTVEELVKFLLKEELKRVSEFDNVIAIEMHILKTKKEAE